jgi:LPXTG-motif cell wall-anchored protein
MRKLFAILAIFVGAVCLMVAPSGADNPNPPNPGVCAGTHLFPPDETTTSITVTAPEGKLISGYCVKAGSLNQGDGPVYVVVDPPAKTVTITHPSGKDISHYVVTYVDEPVETTTSTTAEETTTTVVEETTTTTVDQTTTTVDVGGSSTTVVNETSTTAPGSSTTRRVSAQSHGKGAELPRTGSSTLWLTLLGSSLIAIGLALSVTSRRRMVLP